MAACRTSNSSSVPRFSLISEYHAFGFLSVIERLLFPRFAGFRQNSNSRIALLRPLHKHTGYRLKIRVILCQVEPLTQNGMLPKLRPFRNERFMILAGGRQKHAIPRFLPNC